MVSPSTSTAHTQQNEPICKGRHRHKNRGRNTRNKSTKAGNEGMGQVVRRQMGGVGKGRNTMCWQAAERIPQTRGG